MTSIWFLTPWGSVPSTVNLPIPAALQTPMPLVLQQSGLSGALSSSSPGNFSNAVRVTIQ